MYLKISLDHFFKNKNSKMKKPSLVKRSDRIENIPFFVRVTIIQD